MIKDKYMVIARATACGSRSKLKQVGAVLVSENGKDYVAGHNYSTRKDMKYEFERDGALIPYPEVVHAEETVMLNAGFNLRGSTLYTSVSPCMHCAALIADAGVAKVFYNEQHWNSEALQLLANHGVEVQQIS